MPAWFLNWLASWLLNHARRGSESSDEQIQLFSLESILFNAHKKFILLKKIVWFSVDIPEYI
jgi:hypothetical protein